MKRLLILLIVLLFGYSQNVSAQRTSIGTSAINLQCNYNFNLAGGDVGYSYYLMGGYVYSFFRMNSHRFLFSSGGKLDNWHYTLNAGYMARLFGTRSRSFSFYLGGDAFLGMETNKDSRVFYGTKTSEYKTPVFIYGASARTEAEVFLNRSVAMVFGLRLEYDFGSVVGNAMPFLPNKLGSFCYDCGLGFRFTM